MTNRIMTKNLELILCLLIFQVNLSFCQDSGNQMFDTSVLHEVRITFADANFWTILLNNFDTTPEGQSVPYLQGGVTIDGVIVDSVGIRLKGFTSYNTSTDKKPIKIDFNEFVPGKRYDGLRKLNLNNATADPAMQRDVICYELMRNFGVKAPRVSFSRVYINDEFWGVYQNVEQVDKEFLQNNFTNDDGNLFKNKGWSHFEWNGPNHISYHPPFELKTNKDNPNWDGFVNLMDVLNNATDVEYQEEIEKIFNVDLFLKALAVDVATNNWDSYLEHGRNWYIYEDLVTDVFHWIPWDYNLSLGGQLGGGLGGDCFVFADFFSFAENNTTITFYNQSFATEDVQSYLWDFGDGNTSDLEEPTHTYATAGTYEICLTATVDAVCESQLCKFINTNSIAADCAVIINGSCPHPADIIFAQVVHWQPDCCSTWGIECEDLHSWLSGNGDGGGSSDFSIDQRENQGVLINRLTNTPEINEQYYTEFCDLLSNVMLEDHLFQLIDNNKALISQSVQEDPNFLFTYDEFLTDISHNDISEGLKGIITTRIMDLSMELDSIFNCPEEEAFIAAGDIVINEFMASNDSLSGIRDMAGENDDWLELHNTSGSTVNLSGTYFTNDNTNLKKWQVPYGTRIKPDGYLILWADADTSQFGLHANFKLPKAGGDIIFSNEDGSIIDQVNYAEQITNYPAARIPNGTGPFVLQPATFNYNNETVSSTDPELQELAVDVFPNPAKDLLNINIDATTDRFLARIFSANGQLALSKRLKNNSAQLDLSTLSNGFYILQLKDDDGKEHREKIMVLK